jgi:mannose/fructose/N-acetylgalactosamine-specific phosphotransferase system component IID
MSKCPYSELLGKVGEGVHSYRIFDLAIIDILLTIVFSVIIRDMYFKKTEYYKVIFWMFILGIVLHRIFCVRTTIDKFLFPK